MKNKIFIGILFIATLFVSCNFGINQGDMENKLGNDKIEKKDNYGLLNLYGSFDAEKPEKVVENYFIVSTEKDFDEKEFTNKGFAVKGRLPVYGQNLVFWYIYAEDIKSLRTFKAVEGVTSASWETKVESPNYTENASGDDQIKDIITTRGITEPDPVDHAQGYSLKNTDALKAYQEFGYGPDSNIVYTGIIDTGTNMNHADLDDVVLYAKSCATKNPQTNSDSKYIGDFNPFTEIPLGENWDIGSHGTHCSGTICAKYNGKAINGVAWKNVKLISYQALDAPGGGRSWAIYGAMIDLVNTTEILRKDPSDREPNDVALLPSYLRANHTNYHIKQTTIPVNMSLGGGYTTAFNLFAMTYAMDHDVLPVIAMGNEGAYTNSYPAALPGMLSVGAIDGKDIGAGFSTKGSWINISAPGVGIESCRNNTPSDGSLSEDTKNMSGTSMATPFITGTIAYLLSFDNARNLTPYQLITLLEETADKVPAMDGKDWTDKYGYGRVNVYNAAKRVKENKDIPTVNKKYTESKLTFKGTNNGKEIVLPNVLIRDSKNVPVMCLPGDAESGMPMIVKGLRIGKTYTLESNFEGDIQTETITITDADQEVTFAFDVKIAYVSTVKSLHYNGGKDTTDTAIEIYEANDDGSLDPSAEPMVTYDQGALDTVAFKYEEGKKYYAKVKAFINDDGVYLGGNYAVRISEDPLDIDGVDITDGTRTATENDGHEPDNDAVEARAKGNAWGQSFACNLVSPGDDPSTGKPVEDYDWFYFEAP